MDGERELRIVLLGKTGVGKSSVGNTLLGKRAFEDVCSPQSITQFCERHEKEINGRRIVIVDTPGISDTSRKEQWSEILFYLVECSPGPHVIILVLDVSRHTREHQEAVRTLLQSFTDDVFDHMVLLYTHGYDLEENGTIHDFINSFDADGKQNLKYFAQKCGNRVHVIDNKHWNQNSSSVLADLQNLNLSEQALKEITANLQPEPSDETPWFSMLSEQHGHVETGSRDGREEHSRREYRSNRYQITQLMKSIKEILIKTKAQPYRNKSLEAINEEVNNILEELEDEKEKENMVEIRRRAIERVTTKNQRLFAGVATGTFLGLLFGFGVGLVAPVVFVAGLIRLFRRRPTQQRPQTRKTPVKKKEKNVRYADVAVGVGFWLTVLYGGVRALPFIPLCGAGIGLVSGFHVAKRSDTPKQASRNVILTFRDKAVTILTHAGTS